MRKIICSLLLAAVATTAPTLSLAGNGNRDAHNPAHGANGFCPPGLANRQPACVPPGQAAKFGRGDVIDGDYILIRNPLDYGLDPDLTYYRVADYIYRVDEETREVLDLIGAIDALLN